ncbi:hypothetical protein CN918_31520 [Priestia megaterium]|nr:hypothetical protein CN918_31520 [Priestia megaterium]
MYTRTNHNIITKKPVAFRKNPKYSVRFHQDERQAKSSYSFAFSDGIVERAQQLECAYIHFHVDTIFKEVHLELCKHPRTLDFLPITRKNGAYRKTVYSRSLFLSLQEKTLNYFNLMETYTFLDVPQKPDIFTYYYGNLKPHKNLDKE